MLRRLLAAGLMLASAPAHANWAIQSDQADPFDESKRTFTASSPSPDGAMLAVRCLDGDESLMIIVNDEALSPGDEAHITLAGDGKHTHPEFDGKVLSSKMNFAAIEFASGDHTPFSFFRDVKTAYVRVAAGTHTSTYKFLDNRNLNDILTRADKACGVTD